MLPEFRDLSPVHGAHILVALSGGADSVALVHFLHENRNRCHIRITAAHFNHMIRGKEAEHDESFCRDLCARLGINLIRARADIPAIASKSGLGLETCARNERYRFLRAAKEKCNADFIALAHHANDQAETVLMHLFRGSGPEGIIGMTMISGDLLRPLLNSSKVELIQWLKARNLSWCEDSTNGSADNPRNILRLNIIPEIEKIYPGAQSAILRFTKSMEIENSYLQKLTEHYLITAIENFPVGMRLSTLNSPDPAIIRRAVRTICGSDLSFDKLHKIMELIAHPHQKTDISGKLSCESTEGALWFLDKGYSPPSPVPIVALEATKLTGICMIKITPGTFPFSPNDPFTECIDLDMLAGAELRTRCQGDHMQPLGAPGTRLLSDCMTDKKLERPLRDCLPVIAVKDRILWCPGIGISDEFKITPQTRHPGRLDIQLFDSEVSTHGKRY